MSDMRTEEQHAWDLAFETRDYAAAAQLFESLAARGSEVALLNLGWMYGHGQLGPVDLAKELSFYERAAEHGSGRAKHYLAQALMRAGDRERARAVFLDGAKLGHVACMTMAGTMLARGEGGETDYKAGVAWLERAADSGDAYARRWLLWLEGKRAWDALHALKFDEAVRLYEPLAARGSANALINLGWIHRNRCRGPRDREKGTAYYEKAVRTGDARAKFYLGRALVQNGDLPRARTLFIDGAEQGDTLCMLLAGKVLVRGLGGEADAAAGRAWLARAAEREQVSARRELLRLEMQQSRSPFARLRLWGKRYWIILAAVPRFLRAPLADEFVPIRKL